MIEEEEEEEGNHNTHSFRSTRSTRFILFSRSTPITHTFRGIHILITLDMEEVIRLIYEGSFEASPPRKSCRCFPTAFFIHES